MQALRNIKLSECQSIARSRNTLPLLTTVRFASKTTGTSDEKPGESVQVKKEEVQKPRRTQAEADAALIAAYREKFGGETTATFEDGKPSEMGRAVRNNMFRCNNVMIMR